MPKKYITYPPSQTWPSDQGVDSEDVFGQSDEVIAQSDDPARIILSRLFGPSIQRVILVQDVTVGIDRETSLIARLEGCG